MKELNHTWLKKLDPTIFEQVEGNLLDSYAVALEGWRRGLETSWYHQDAEEFKNFYMWSTETPGQLFSLSSNESTRLFFRTRSDVIPDHAVNIAKNKQHTRMVMQENNQPVPLGYEFQISISFTNLKEFVKDIDGYPVVIKPKDGSFGRGVFTNIQSDNELKECYDAIVQNNHITDYIIENHIKGQEYRFYVVGNEVVAAINRIPANVTGDGKRSIKELIEEKNNLRSKNPRLKSCLIKIDEEIVSFLHKQNFTSDSVPSNGEVIYLTDKSNISAGGDSVDVLNDIDNEVKNIAIQAIAAVEGLQHGGVDIMISDHNSREAYIIEINPTAQIGSLIFPMYGEPRDVPSKIVDYYFPSTKQMTTEYFDLVLSLSPLDFGALKVTLPEINELSNNKIPTHIRSDIRKWEQILNHYNSILNNGKKEYNKLKRSKKGKLVRFFTNNRKS